MTTANASSAAAAPALARAVLQEVVPTSATRPGYIVLAVPGSQYQLHLRPEGAITAEVGKRITGVITCQARRVDVAVTGGRFVEPVMGRPRRIQGTVLSVSGAGNTITLNAGGGVVVDGLPLPIVCALTDPRQKAEQFAPGQLVGFDVLDGATFAQR